MSTKLYCKLTEQKKPDHKCLTFKGQLISWGLFGVLNSSKNEKKWPNSNLKPQVELFLEELRILKSPFEIKWPLAEIKMFHAYYLTWKLQDQINVN